MSGDLLIELSVPGKLQFCDVARRVVMESCKILISEQTRPSQVTSNTAINTAIEPATTKSSSVLPSGRYEFHDQFTLEFISAFSEIFNNVALHAYAGKNDGTIDFRIQINSDHLIVDIHDMGTTFDIQAVPLPDELPTGGMGIFIARSMLDELDYKPGPPNRWRLTKYIQSNTSGAHAQESVASD